MIEAFNKVIKEQFLNPININNREELVTSVFNSVEVYNNIRPQLRLNGNTPNELFEGNSNVLSNFKEHFGEHRLYRIEQNKKNRCLKCIP